MSAGTRMEPGTEPLPESLFDEVADAFCWRRDTCVQLGQDMLAEWAKAVALYHEMHEPEMEGHEPVGQSRYLVNIEQLLSEATMMIERLDP